MPISFEARLKPHLLPFLPLLSLSLLSEDAILAVAPAAAAAADAAAASATLDFCADSMDVVVDGYVAGAESFDAG